MATVINFQEYVNARGREETVETDFFTDVKEGIYAEIGIFYQRFHWVFFHNEGYGGNEPSYRKGAYFG